MVWLVLIVLVLLMLAVVAIKLKQPLGQVEGYPYAKKQVLFSPAERSFLGVLDQAVGEEYRVFGKVRVADIVEPQRGLDNSRRQKALNRISAKHFDFVLCAKGDLSIVCAVEFDDQSHEQRRRQERDAFLVGVCKAISLPLIQVPAQRAYSVPELRAKVLGVLGLGQGHESALEPAPIQGQASLTASALGALAAAEIPLESEGPACPKCSAPMVRRQAKTGSNAGQEFWGCSTFPKCRGVIRENAQQPH